MGDDDLTFVFRYWYLSLFYFSFWLQMPLVGWWLAQRESNGIGGVVD